MFDKEYLAVVDLITKIPLIFSTPFFIYFPIWNIYVFNANAWDIIYKQLYDNENVLTRIIWT